MSDGGYEGYQTWKSWNPQSFATFDAASAAYFTSEFAACGLTSMVGTKVLEIGFGNAGFAAWATANGAEYTGLEAIAELVESGRARGLNVFNATTSLCDIAAVESLDLVVALDVFEHVEIGDLRTLLDEAILCLQKGGLMVVRMPSGDSPFSRAIQHGDLTHKTILGSSAMRQLALSAGYEVVDVRSPSFPVMGGGWRSLHRRLAVAFGRAIVYPVISLVLMGGGDPVLSPNMMCVLRKK